MMLPLKEITLFALSRTPDPERMSRGLETLRSWGIQYTLPVLNSRRYLATTDADDFNRQLESSCDAMLAACGGFGAIRLLEHIDFDRLVARRIPIIGYSDVCALHLAAYKAGSRTQIHGPMLCNHFGTPSDFTMESLTRALRGENPFLPGKLECLRPGTATAPIIASNLTILCSLIGTPYMPDLSGHILAIEDIGEAAYRIDRMLAQLRIAGHLQNLKGLIYGQFTDCEDAEYIPEVLAEYAGFIQGPVVSNLQFGHVSDTLSIPLGAMVTLEATNSGVMLSRIP